jgi:di/tricarboxylate transporter
VPLTTDMGIVFLILLGTLVLFVVEVVAVDLVALLALAALLVTGILNVNECLQGLASPAVVTVASMFVLSEGLSRTGAVNWITQRLGQLAGTSGRGWVVTSLLIVMVTSAFINNTAVVVLFIPVMLSLARRFRVSPSKLLIPVSFVSILGGTCTLIGTSTNILVSSVATSQGQPAFTMFEFTPVGIIVALFGLFYIVYIAPRLLPQRATMITFTEEDGEDNRQYVTEVEVLEQSNWVGKPLRETLLGRRPELRVLEVIRDETILAPREDIRLVANDLLLIQGEANDLFNVDQSGHVSVLPELAGEGGRLGPRVDVSLAEIVITPNSRFVGSTVREAGFRRRYGVSVFAIQRGGRHLRRSIGDLELRVGDVLLLQGSQKSFQNLQEARSFLFVKGTVDTLTRPGRAPLALAIMAGVIASATFELIPIQGAALLGALAMMLARCLTPREAYASQDMSVLMLIVGTLALGAGLNKTDAAAFLVHQIGTVKETLGPHGLLWALYILAAALTSAMSNNATAVLLTPLAIQLAATLSVDPRPYLLAVVFGSSAAFATPVGYQTNTLVFGPGGYFFRDFLRVGLPLNAISCVVACVTIPWFFPF